MKRICFCALILIMCLVKEGASADGAYQESYEALMKQGLGLRQTEFYSGALSYRLEEGYAVFSHFNETRKLATFALVSFDVNNERKGLLELFCREHARELLLRKWLREYIRAHLEDALNERLDAFEEASDTFSSIKGAIEDARGACQELLFGAFAQYDLESICRGVLEGCMERTEVAPLSLKGGNTGWFFFAQYFIDGKAAEKKTSEDVRRIMTALRRVVCGELAKVALRRQSNAVANAWSDSEYKLMRAYVVLIYVLGDDFANWSAFCAGNAPLIQAPKSFRWGEFVNLIFKD